MKGVPLTSVILFSQKPITFNTFGVIRRSQQINDRSSLLPRLLISLHISDSPTIFEKGILMDFFDVKILATIRISSYQIGITELRVVLSWRLLYLLLMDNGKPIISTDFSLVTGIIIIIIYVLRAFGLPENIENTIFLLEHRFFKGDLFFSPEEVGEEGGVSLALSSQTLLPKEVSGRPLEIYS